ncbi:hypothetical protein AVEN_175261-1 [Araneus ventricosus]|uniref:Uncharacterized protein n=1 Tax=Araneus ventricosus TaxID=182803 RepID=A0A4Y2F1G6_ARAVE|nr:hypothetical protein AVEN_175261-1 [Araneus ventricosus]
MVAVRCTTGANPSLLSILSEYQGSYNCASCICVDCYLPFVCAQVVEVLPSGGCRGRWNFWCGHLVVGLKVDVACSSGSPLRQYEDSNLVSLGSESRILTTRQKEFPMSGDGYGLINITVRRWQYGALQCRSLHYTKLVMKLSEAVQGIPTIKHSGK